MCRLHFWHDGGHHPGGRGRHPGGRGRLGRGGLPAGWPQPQAASAPAGRWDRRGPGGQRPAAAAGPAGSLPSLTAPPAPPTPSAQFTFTFTTPLWQLDARAVTSGNGPK